MVNRDKQTAIIRAAQEKRKQQKREEVFRAIEEIRQSGKPLNFPNIAKVAGCSISYLYKWTELTEYIHDLQKKAEPVNTIQDKTPGTHSLKTLHEASKQRIRSLETENQELKRQNEVLRGHVGEIYELRDECERLRKLVRKYETANSSSKVIPLHSYSQEPEKPINQSEPKKLSINEELSALGISLNSSLSNIIKKANESTVLAAIEALKEQLTKGDIKNPGGWLASAIKNGWAKPEPITKSSSPQPIERDEVKIDPNKKQVSEHKLKFLSSIFNQKDHE
jgi:hypothetical protein